MTERLSLPLARRIALAAQGFGEPRPDGPVDARRVARTIRRLGLLQIDSVNVLARAHYVPLYSRLGPYDTALLDTAAWGRPRKLFEYWAHEASLLPVETQPLFRWRMQRARRQETIYGGLARFARERGDYLEAVLAAVATRGPTTAGDLEGARGEGGWWGWSDPKRALECLFWEGRLTTATRRGFERVYDLPERVFPREVMATPDPHPADAQRALIAHAARALGVATAADLRDYFRFAGDEGTAAITELVEAGELIPVRVDGWTQKAWLHRDARLPRRIAARALLSPFDPVVWERGRTERLFGFRYRIEIYVPAHRRVHGYYVLPFLLGDRLVARVDLKADRAAGTLRVQSAHGEPDAPPETAEALRAELRTLAGWLGLERMVVAPVGDLAEAVGAGG